MLVKNLSYSKGYNTWNRRQFDVDVTSIRKKNIDQFPRRFGVFF